MFRFWGRRENSVPPEINIETIPEQTKSLFESVIKIRDTERDYNKVRYGIEYDDNGNETGFAGKWKRWFAESQYGRITNSGLRAAQGAAETAVSPIAAWGAPVLFMHGLERMANAGIEIIQDWKGKHGQTRLEMEQCRRTLEESMFIFKRLAVQAQKESGITGETAEAALNALKTTYGQEREEQTESNELENYVLRLKEIQDEMMTKRYGELTSIAQERLKRGKWSAFIATSTAMLTGVPLGFHRLQGAGEFVNYIPQLSDKGHFLITNTLAGIVSGIVAGKFTLLNYIYNASERAGAKSYLAHHPGLLTTYKESLGLEQAHAIGSTPWQSFVGLGAGFLGLAVQYGGERWRAGREAGEAEKIKQFVPSDGEQPQPESQPPVLSGESPIAPPPMESKTPLAPAEGIITDITDGAPNTSETPEAPVESLETEEGVNVPDRDEKKELSIDERMKKMEMIVPGIKEWYEKLKDKSKEKITGLLNTGGYNAMVEIVARKAVADRLARLSGEERRGIDIETEIKKEIKSIEDNDKHKDLREKLSALDF